MPTPRRLLSLAAAQLPASDSPRLDAEVLLASLLKVDRGWLYAHPQAEVPEGAATAFAGLMRSRQQGRPVAYLTGVKEFWSLPLKVNEGALVPRPETELLVEWALERVPEDAGWQILDLGAGCGAIAVAVAASRPYCHITAADISEDALLVAQENAAALGLVNVRFCRSDWFANLPRERFDAVLCNPPYVDFATAGPAADKLRHEPQLALDGGRQGRDCLRAVIAAARRRLKSGGFVIVEHAHDQGAFAREEFRRRHYRDIATRRDYASHERHSMAAAP